LPVHSYRLPMAAAGSAAPVIAVVTLLLAG
jgi:hypothetical protein